MLDILLPDVPGLVLTKIYYGPQRLLLFAASLSSQECCPLCQMSSNRVYSHYTRQISDLPWADFTIELLVQVRRFYCTNKQCRRLTFAQRLGPLSHLMPVEPSEEPLNSTPLVWLWAVKRALVWLKPSG